MRSGARSKLRKLGRERQGGRREGHGTRRRLGGHLVRLAGRVRPGRAPQARGGHQRGLASHAPGPRSDGPTGAKEEEGGMTLVEWTLRQRAGIVVLAVSLILSFWSLWIAFAVGSTSPWGFVSLVLMLIVSIMFLIGAGPHRAGGFEADPHGRPVDLQVRQDPLGLRL